MSATIGRHVYVWTCITTLVLGATTTWTSPATALDLQFNYVDGDNPSFDPDGSVLMSMVSVVEDYYEDIIEDNWTIPIQVRWRIDLAPGVLGEASTSRLNVETPFGTKRRANIAGVRLNSGASWYVDPDPSDHSEFELEQVLYRDLSSNSQDIGFPDGAPDLLEAGYSGLGSTGGYDLLSVVFHEVGHVLGVGAGQPETDGVYNFLPHQINGEAVSRAATADGHLRNVGDRAVMVPSISFNQRTLPSAVDMLAMAAASGWGDIDLPRKELLAGPGWNTGLNWLGGRVPDSDDEVTVRIGSSVTLSGAAQGHSLRIAEGTNLNTSGRNLTIGSGGLQVVDNAKLLVTGDSSVSVGGAVQIENGTLALDIDSNGANKVLADEFVLDGGILEVDLDASLLSILSIGQRATILESHSGAFGSVIGNFDQMVLTGTSFQDLYDLGMALAVDYVDASIVSGVRLSSGVAVEVAIPGDYNLSGMVELGDLNLVLANWGSMNATWAEGDVDGDGFVGLADYNAVLAFWGTMSGGGGSLAAAVPEPSTFSLTSLALLGLIGYARRK